MNAREITDKKRLGRRRSKAEKPAKARTRKVRPERARLEKERWAKAKRRLSYLTPDNAHKVLRHDRYWTVELMELYLRRCEHLRMTVPMDGWKMVQHAVELVELIRIGEAAGDFGSRAERLSWSARASALEGEIAGLVDSESVAEQAFRRALELTSRERIQVLAAAELQRRRAAFEMRRGRRSRACRYLEQSLVFFRRLDAGSGLAEALLLAGFLRCPEKGLVGLAEALACTRPKGILEERIFDAALTLLMERMQEPRVTFEEYEAILGWLYLARKRWFARRSKTVRKMGLLWAEGRVLACLGLGRLAQRRLSRAWQGLTQLGAFEAVAVAGLDLAYVQVGHDERPLAMEVLRESRQRIRRLSADRELIQALHGAESLTLSELLEARRALAERRLPSFRTFYPFGAQPADAESPETEAPDTESPDTESPDTESPEEASREEKPLEEEPPKSGA